MDKGTKIEKFNFVCFECEKAQTPQSVTLYVNWPKRYYMLICLNCNSMEAFDEFGKKVELKEDNTKLPIN